MTKTPQKTKIPKFRSYQEEAEFWDSHDFTEFEGEFKPVKVKFAKNLSQGITIRFDPQTLDTLRFQAARKGIGATTLVRMWVMERLSQKNAQHQIQV